MAKKSMVMVLLAHCIVVGNCYGQSINTIVQNENSKAANKAIIKNPKQRKMNTTEKNNAIAYKLVWADEFDNDGLPDSKKWGYDIGTGEWGWGNNEKEYYTNRKENVTTSKGILKITAQKEDYMGSQYTSTRMVTKNKFSFTYGKVVARAKLPQGVGTWPAIWMLGSNKDIKGWPACGEIDIMEHKGSELNKIYGTLHYPDHFGEKADGHTVNILNATTQFHIYMVEWSASNINFFIDGKQFKSFKNNSSTAFNQDFDIIINLAMGGLFAGAIDTTFAKASLEVDYIRVYQK